VSAVFTNSNHQARLKPSGIPTPVETKMQIDTGYAETYVSFAEIATPG
jgi:hypothetical protein